MNSIAEIQSALRALPVKDARTVAHWLQDYLDERWDQQMDRDVAAGRLEPLWERANADIAAGRVNHSMKPSATSDF